MLRFKPKPIFWLMLLPLLFCSAVFAQATGGTSTLPSGGEIKDWATIGVILTAAISVLNRAIGLFYKGEMSEVAKRAIAGVVCLGAAVWYGAQNGYFTEFNPRNIASIIAAIGIITTVAKNFYDGLSQPVGKVLKQSSEPKTPDVKNEPVTTKQILLNKGEEAAIELLRKEAAERGYGGVASLVLGSGLSFAPANATPQPESDDPIAVPAMQTEEDVSHEITNLAEAS